jgi:hypothetical protein
MSLECWKKGLLKFDDENKEENHVQTQNPTSSIGQYSWSAVPCKI